MQLIGLREHGLRDLQQNILLRVLGHFLRHVRVAEESVAIFFLRDGVIENGFARGQGIKNLVESHLRDFYMDVHVRSVGVLNHQIFDGKISALVLILFLERNSVGNLRAMLLIIVRRVVRRS